MQREILKPRWDDIAKKDRVITTFRYTSEDGSVRDVKASITNSQQPDGSNNPDWVEIMDTFGEDTIDQNTQERLDSIAEIEAQRRDEGLRREERRFQEMLFDTKLDVFEHPIIENLTDLDSKRNIRRSDNINRIFIDVAEAMIKDAFTRSGLDYVAPKSTDEDANTVSSNTA